MYTTVNTLDISSILFNTEVVLINQHIYFQHGPFYIVLNIIM